MGETRYRAAKKRGDKTIDIYVGVPPKDDKTRIIGQLIENLQQSGLKPLATAIAFDELKREHGMTGEQIAKTVGKPTSFVSKHLRLVTAPESVTALLRDKITSDVDLAYTLIQVTELSSDEGEKLVQEARQSGITRNQVKQSLDKLKGKDKENISHAKSKSNKSASAKNKDKHIAHNTWQVVVEFDNQEGTIMTDRDPEEEGYVWVKVEIGEISVEAANLRVKGLKPEK
jgi:ParB family chromosome partitioning protein